MCCWCNVDTAASRAIVWREAEEELLFLTTETFNGTRHMQNEKGEPGLPDSRVGPLIGGSKV